MAGFRPRLLIALLEAGSRVRSHETGAAQHVRLPELHAGRHMLAQIRTTEPDAFLPEYDSVVPWTCQFDDATVFGPIGIVCVGRDVVSDTLAYAEDHYVSQGGRVTPQAGGVRHALAGTTLSLLVAGSDAYFHWMIDGIGRLAAADPALVAASQHVLVPRLRHAFQRDSLVLAGLAGKHIVELDAGDFAECETLLLPCRMFGDWRPHPALRDYFVGIAAAAPPAGSGPERVYVDRRGGANRVLANEDEVIAALSRQGFVAVRTEALSLAQQVALFAGARIVVGPHGAGLTNILFARAGAALVELQMDAYATWMYRIFAAFGGIDYDCVIGRQSGQRAPPPDAPPRDARWIDQQVWQIPITHMLAVVEAALARLDYSVGLPPVTGM